jgi:hypothetical protein
MSTRRRFLKAGTMFALAAGVSGKFNNLAFGQRAARVGPAETGLLEPPIESQLDVLFNLRSTSFSPYISSIFQVLLKNGIISRNVSLTLIKVERAPAFGKAAKALRNVEVESAGLDSFSLVFRGTNRVRLPQDVYDLGHPALGTIRVLVVPIMNRDTNNAYYEVIVNRARP